MRKWAVISIVVISAAAIIAVIIVEHRSTLPGRRPANPFAYDVEEFRSVDQELIRWREARQVELDSEDPRAMTYASGKIYLASQNELQVIGSDWSRILRRTLPAIPTCLAVAEEGWIVVGMGNRLAVLNSDGETVAKSEPLPAESNITSLAILGDDIYAADASGRRVLIFNRKLEQTGEFRGDSGVSDVHGFIVPGAHFTLAVNSEDELWITNPGIHSLQNYTASGRLRSYIQRSSFGIDGFSGCCNPVHFTFLPDGRFVTSEKGIIRIKVIIGTGEVESVVAPSELFREGTRAPAVAVDDNGNVLALDFDRNMIRIFEPI
ncbi:MAG: hypothetical protein EA408_02110 [Marinilabiliales bacterium]|nr:MAG: hypothetical protein EA408_02110 [Marinilabiliales bacterium]